MLDIENGSEYNEFNNQPWHMQENPNSCAVCAQEFILEKYGKDFTESQLIEMAKAEGWYRDTGTDINDIGKILAHEGVPVDIKYSANIDDIEKVIDDNRCVLAVIDSSELTKDGVPLDFGQGHVVEILDINKDKGTVTVCDSADPNGKSVEYNLKEFQEAWNDSNNFMVETTTERPMEITGDIGGYTKISGTQYIKGHKVEVSGGSVYVDGDKLTSGSVSLGVGKSVDASGYLRS